MKTYNASAKKKESPAKMMKAPNPAADVAKKTFEAAKTVKARRAGATKATKAPTMQLKKAGMKKKC